VGGATRRFVSQLVWPSADAHRNARRVVAHEWFTTMGGSDKVAARLVELAEAEVVYVFALDAQLVERLGVKVPVVTWRFGEKLSSVGSFHLLLPLMPLVWRALDLSAAALVVTSSHACVNAVSAPGARRVSYVHTPMRYVWFWRLERDRVGAPLRWLLPVAAPAFRVLDRWWSSRVDTFVANSRFVADRIAKSYGRDAMVISPPVDTEFFSPAPVDDRSGPFVLAGRLVAYKQARVVVEAANRAGVRIVVAGNGPELPALRALAGPTVSFVVDPSDDDFRELFRTGRALLFPGIEDFGIVPVEAQACGMPVIARADGGARETVVDGVTGLLVESDDPVEWAAALANFNPQHFDPVAIRRNAERFTRARFDEQIAAVLAR
jgi:glycosyltransferase involved in cell wall biosynthesis